MRSLAALVACALLLVACGSTPAGSGGPPTGAPSATPAPTVAPTNAPVGTECAAVPTFNLGSPGPTFSFTRDPALEAHFPQQIDGQPVTEVTSASLLEMLCMFGGQSGLDQARQQAPAGTDLLRMTFASAKATVDGEEVSLNAFRTPGMAATTLLQNLTALSRALGGDLPDITGSLTPAVAGGKTVSTWTDAEGVTSYMYATGDTLVVVDSVTASQADKIFAAVP